MRWLLMALSLFQRQVRRAPAFRKLAGLPALPKPQSPMQLLNSLPKFDLSDPANVKPGMYDPSIDMQGAQEQLGASYTLGSKAVGLPGSDPGDIHTGLYGQSGTYVDPATGQQEQFSTPGLLAALQQRHDTALQRGQEDYNTSTGNLQRNYQNLGVSQAERARAAGVAEGGSLAQALQKRTANQARDQSGLDTNWRRFQDDTNNQYNTDRNNALAQAFTQSTRGIGAHELFQSQLGDAKLQSAQQLGTLPTAPPPGTVPTLNSFLRTGSLVGSGLDANSPIYRRPKPRRTR